MNDKAPDEDDKLPEAEAEERFKRLVGNLVNTPHTPHKTKMPSGFPEGAKGSVPK